MAQPHSNRVCLIYGTEIVEDESLGDFYDSANTVTNGLEISALYTDAVERWLEAGARRSLLIVIVGGDLGDAFGGVRSSCQHY